MSTPSAPGLDDVIPNIGMTERELNRLALALHVLDDATPGTPPAATWGTLWTLLRLPVTREHADVPFVRPSQDVV